jgi:4-aminobutyrate aminotransferase-like enzyme
VHVLPLPDTYRGKYRADDPRAGEKYAEFARYVSNPGAFIAESAPSVGGQIVLPDRYLASVYAIVRAAGGVCIADEVQTAYGRMGEHFYAFEAQRVVPDIVVLGKPIGNGYPLGAVVATPEIAASFDNGMEFFSTFGGSTVACAVGLAVLEVVQEERRRRAAAATAALDDRRPSARGRHPRERALSRRRAGEGPRDARAGRCGSIRNGEPHARARHPARHRRPVPQRPQDPPAHAFQRR